MSERLSDERLTEIRRSISINLPHTDANFALREQELDDALDHIEYQETELRERISEVVRLSELAASRNVQMALLQADIARLNEECERLRRDQVPDGDKPQPRDPYKYVNDYTEGPDGTFIRAERPKGE